MSNKNIEAPLLLKQPSGDPNQQLTPQAQQVELQELQDILSQISKRFPTHQPVQSNPSSQGAQGAPGSQFFLPRLPKDQNFLKFIQIPDQKFILAGQSSFRVKEGRAMPRGPDFKVTDGRITCLVLVLKKDNSKDLVFGDSLGNVIRFSYPECKLVKSYQVFNGPVNKLVYSDCLYSAGDNLIKFNDDWKFEIIHNLQVLDFVFSNKNLALCSSEGIEHWSDSKLLITKEKFEKVSLSGEILAAGRQDLIQVWKIQDQEVTLLNQFPMNSPLKLLKLSESGIELGVLNEKGEVKVLKLDEDIKPKVFSVSSGIRDVIFNESLSELIFITSDTIDKFILNEWTDEYFIRITNKISSFYVHNEYFAWVDESGLNLFNPHKKERKKFNIAAPASKILKNSDFVFVLSSGKQIDKAGLSELGDSDVNWVEVSKADESLTILDFAVDDARLVYALSSSFVNVVDLASNQVISTTDLTLRGRPVPISNLQIFSSCFYASSEASMFKIVFIDPSQREQCFIDWQGKIKLAKVSPDQVIILKSEPPSADASSGSSVPRPSIRASIDPSLDSEGSKSKRPVISPQVQQLIQSSNKFKLYYPGRQKFVREFSFHSGGISNFEFTSDNLYFLVSSEDCKISLWSRETLDLITFVNYCKPIINFSLNDDFSRLFIVHVDEVSVVKSPVNKSDFFIVGPDQSRQYEILNYFKKIAEHSGKDEGIRSNFSPYVAEMDNYVICPSLASPVHFYAGYQYYDAYQRALFNNSSFHNTRLGINPLFLMLWRDEQDSVIKTISLKCTAAENNPFVFGFVNHRTLEEINNRGYPGSETFYEAVYQQFTKIGLPKYAASQDSLPMAVYSDSLEPNKKQFLREDQYNVENFPIIFSSSCIKVNMVPGSQESLNLLKSFAECPNQEVFTKPFVKILLVEKWKRVKWMMMIQAGVYLAYMICLMGFIVFFSNTNELKEVESPGSPAIATIFLLLGQAINIILAFYEVYQIIQMKSEYFKDVWNYVDMVRFLFYTILMIFILSSDSNLINSRFYLFLEVLVILLTWIRGLTFFRLFDSVRYLTALIFEVMYDMLSFSALAGYSLIGLSLMLFACTDSTQDDKYFDFLGFTYMTTIGEYSSFGKDIQNFQSLGVTIFTMTSIINTIVMMNLLISIIGDTFDRVQQGRNVTDFKELVSMIYEMETLINSARNEKQRIYLQRLSVRFGTGEELGVWEGRVRELMKVINSVRFDVKSSLRMLVSEKEDEQAASDEIKQRINDLEKKHDNDMKEVKESLRKICEKLGT